jgi:hypothetical protein
MLRHQLKPNPVKSHISGVTMTRAEFAQDMDIAKIMERARRGNFRASDFVDKARAYGDFSQIPDLATMKEKIITANDMFLTLPAELRRELDNKAENLLACIEKPEGHELLAKYGLLKKIPKDITKHEPPKGFKNADGTITEQPKATPINGVEG